MRFAHLTLAAVFVLLGTAGCGGGSSNLPVPAQQSFAIAAGASDTTAAFEVLQFYPANIVIDAGDTLNWTITSGSPHVIALVPAGQMPPGPPQNSMPAGGSSFDGRAFVSSGLIATGKTYSLTFTQPGTYQVLCLVHLPEMSQTVVVQPAGASRPKSPSTIVAAAQSQSATDVLVAQGTLAGFPFPAGGTHLTMGLAPHPPPPSIFSIYRFLDGPSLAANVTIPAGTTLTWTNASNVPHNVVFPVAGQPIPANFNDLGPPIGGPTYDGTTLVSSGFTTPGKNFSLTFTKPGTYTYFCSLHDNQGMTSTVTVL